MTGSIPVVSVRRNTGQRDTLQPTAAHIYCLERELEALEAAHSRLWKAANQAGGGEPVEDIRKLEP